MLGFVSQRRMANPMIASSEKAPRYAPLWRVLSLAYAMATATTQAHTYGGTLYSWALVSVQSRSRRMVGRKTDRPWTVMLMRKKPRPHV